MALLTLLSSFQVVLSVFSIGLKNTVSWVPGALCNPAKLFQYKKLCKYIFNPSGILKDWINCSTRYFWEVDTKAWKHEIMKSCQVEITMSSSFECLYETDNKVQIDRFLYSMNASMKACFHATHKMTWIDAYLQHFYVEIFTANYFNTIIIYPNLWISFQSWIFV